MFSLPKTPKTNNVFLRETMANSSAKRVHFVDGKASSCNFVIIVFTRYHPRENLLRSSSGPSSVLLRMLSFISKRATR